MFAVRNTETGEIQFVESLEGYEEPEWENTGELPDGLTPDQLARYELTPDGWQENPDLTRAALIAQVKQEREQHALSYYTPSATKILAYQAKQAEVAAWKQPDSSRDPSAYPYAAADAEAHGDQLEDAIARFVGGIAASDGGMATVEAIEHAAIAAITAAADVDGMYAALNAVDWTWEPTGA